MELRLAVISVLVASALSGPVKNLNSNTQCAAQCTSKNKFGYRVGTIYEYSYEAETKTGIQGSTEEQGGIKITATAEIEILSKCEFLLTVKNSNVLGSDPDYPRQFKQHPQRSEFQTELEGNSLRFSFQDGIVEELCPEDGDSDWSLNFKRGILSAFQNSMDSLDMDTEVTETDVSGKCPTTYRVKQEGWRTVKVKKTKDLVSCSNRHGFQTSAQATIYSIPSSVQSLPLLKSSQECDQDISTEGRIESTVCHEIHFFRPFSKGNNGAMTEVIQHLKFVTQKRGGQLITDSVTKRESMLYHHYNTEIKTSNKKDVAIKKLTELCTSTKDGITAETPKLFSELVYALKELNSNDLTEVYEQSQIDSFCIDNSERVKKFYSDAVPMIGTTAAVKQIAKLILNNDITGRMAEIWLSSLSLIQNPSKEMLTEISKLMDLPEGTRVYLPASVMVNTYCKENKNCESIPEIEAIINKLQQAVGSSCIVTENNYLEVITSLRAIGNIEYADRLVSTVNACIQKKTNEMEIRVAAVEAYRRMSCGADRNNLMILYRDDSEDSELRITAYIQMMKCPTDNILSQIKETLANEEVNQVGSFVWTHLTNLMETSLVHKQNIQRILEDEVLKKEFDLDKRKFSRNYEWSYFSERMNAGAGLESNLVWSQKSFVPRSAMVNLTVDLFGHSVNLFELGGRVEGLEKILIENFGPKGSFGAKQDLAPEQKLSRDVDFNKVGRISEKLDKTEDELKGSVFMRMFGNEISYYNTKQSSDNNIESKPFNFLDLFMNLANEQEFSQKMSKMLLDSSIIVPTVTGLPLNLKVIATSTIDLNAKGKMDFRSPSKSIVLEGSISPSGAVEVSSTMSIDAFVTKSGLKMVSNFHTSTAVTAKFELDKNQELTMLLDIPKEKSEILQVKSQFFIVHAGTEKEQQMIAKDRLTKRSCSGATIARVTGVEFCIDMSLPGDVQKTDAPHFPLTGPARFGLDVFKRDTHTSYKFEFKNIMNKKKAQVMMLYDTPGSQVMRKTGFNFEMDHENQKMEMSMVSPWKTAQFEGDLQNKAKRKRVLATVSVDSKKLYQAEAFVAIIASKSATTYKPKIEIIRPDLDPIVLGGDIVYRPGKVMTSKLVLTGAMEKPVSLDLSVRFTKTQYGMTATILHSKDQKYTADINLEMNEKPKRKLYKPKIILAVPGKEFINFYGTIDFNEKKGKVMRYDIILDKVLKQPIKLKGESSIIVKGRRNIYKGKVYFVGPQKITTRVRYLYDKKLRATTTSVKLDYNFQKMFKGLKDSLQFNSKLLKKTQKSLQRIGFDSNLKSARFADYNNQLKLKIDHRPNSKVDADLTVDYGKTYMSKVNKHRLSILTATKYNINEKKGAGIINYNVTFQLPAEKLDSYISGTHKYSKTEVKSNLHLRYDNKKSADVSLSLMDQSKKLFKYSGDVALKFTGRHIQLSGSAVEKEKEYNTKMSIQHQEGHTSSFSAAYSFPDNEKREIASSLNIDQQPPVTLSGSAVMNIRKPEGTVKVKVDKDFYVVSGQGTFDGDSYVTAQGKVAYPSRQITIDTEGGLKKDEYSGKIDVNWDARNKRDLNRVVVEGSLRNNTVEDFTVSSRIMYPGRDLSARIDHNSKDKLDTSVSVGWNKDDAVSAAVKFDKDIRKYRRHIEGSVSLTTPWKQMQEFKIGGNHAENNKKMAYGATLTWNKGKTIAFQYESKLPIDKLDIDMKLSLKTPLPRIGNPTLKLQSTISDNLIQQQGNIKVTWGTDQFFELETNGDSNHGDITRKLNRNIGVLTSFDGYKVITLNWTHSDNLEKFLSKAIYIIDGTKYEYVLNMNHVMDGWSIENKGTFDIISPFDSLKINWSHLNKDKDLETIIDTKWSKGQEFHAKATANIEEFPNRKYTANLEMRIPSAELSHLIVGLEHEDKIGYIKSKGKIIANRENIGTVTLNFAKQLGSTDFDFRMSSKYMRDFIIDGKTRHAHLPMTGLLKIQWEPLKRIVLDGSIHYNNIGTLDSKLEVTTPFQQAQRIILTATHKMDRLDWVAEAELEFAPMRKVSAAVRYNTGLEKLVRLEITTPFPQFQKLSTGAYFKFITQPSHWENKVDFEIVPVVGQIMAVTTWQYNTKTRGTFRLDTPFQQIPFMSAEVDSEIVLGRTNSKLLLEYLPTQKIELTSTYKWEKSITDIDDFDGFISIKTPFNDDIIAKYRQKEYVKDKLEGFHRRVQLKYKRTQNIVIETTLGTRPKIFGIIEVKMPVRGYETVKLSVGHKGTTLKDFHTTLDYETNGKKVELEALFDIVGDIQGKLMLTSPFETVKIAKVEYSHVGTSTNFKTHGETVFNDNKVDSDVVFTHNNQQTTGSFTFRGPVNGADDVILSFNKDGTWKKFSFNGEAGYESGSKYVVVLKHSLEGKDAATDLVIQNPLTEDIIMKVSYDDRRKGFTTIIEGSVGTENSVKMVTTYKLKNFDLDLDISLKTVIAGETQESNLVIEHKGQLTDFTFMGKVKTSYANIDDKIKIAFKGSNKIDDIDAKFEIQDTWKPISIVTRLKSFRRKDGKIITESQYNDNILKSEVSAADVRGKYTGKITVVTKIKDYEYFEFEVDHVNYERTAKNTITMKPFTYKPLVIESDIKFMGITMFGADVKLTSGFKGLENIEANLVHKGNYEDFESSLTIKKANMVPIKLEARLNAVILSNIDGSIKFTSGIEGAEMVEGTLKHTGSIDDFACEVVVKIPNRVPVQFNVQLSKNIPGELIGKVTFTSDIVGAKNVEFSIEQLYKNTEFKQRIVISPPNIKPITNYIRLYKKGNEIEAEYHFTSDFETIKDVDFEMIKDFKITMAHNGDPMNFVNTLTFSHPKSGELKLISKLNINDDYTDITGDVKIESTLKGAERLHLTLTHAGAPQNFRNKITMRPPFNDEMELSTSATFKNREALDISIDFSSKIPNAENVGFSTSNKIIDGIKGESLTEIKLDSLRKITIDFDGKFQLDTDNAELGCKFDMITPFEKVKTINAEYSASMKTKRNLDEAVSTGRKALLFSHNGVKYFDTQGTFETIDGKSFIYDFNMEEPRPIEFNYNVQIGEPYSVNVYTNWDKMDINSNIKIESKFENMNDFKIKATHPTRTVSLEGAFKGELEKTAKLIINWDEDKNQAAGIETKWQDQRPGLDMIEGSARVITPFRSVEASGSVNKVLATQSIDGTVLWDADSDRTKKVTVNTEMTPDSNGYSGKVQLFLPVFGKELTFRRQLTENEGNIIHDAKTEFSYSSDPSKTIIFTSKLEDISEGGSTNHSYTFGVAQAFTKVDTSITTHLGRSDDKDSVGMLIKYQTAELQKKNLLLMAEIDKLNKKLILLTVGPRKTIGIVGQIKGDNTVTVNIRGLHALEDIVEADIIIDSNKKAMELQMKYDRANPNNMLHVAAKYPSKTNFEAQIYRTGDKPQITDSVIKVNLRTTRILHSKLTWRPSLFKDLMQFGVDTIEHYGKSANTEFIATANDMEKEVSAKFDAISAELEKELTPYINSMTRSLRVVQKQLKKAKDQMDKMYKANDMYVKDVTDGIRQKTSSMMELYRKTVTEMKDAVNNLRKKLEEFKDLKTYPFDAKYKEFVNNVASGMQSFKQEMVDFLKTEMDTVTQKMKSTVETFRKDVKTLTDKITKEVAGVLDNVLEKAEIKELMSYVDDILKNLPDSTNLPEIDWQYYINKINKAIKYKLSKLDLSKAYNEVVETTKNAVMNQLEPIMQDEKVKEMKELADQLQKKITWAYKQWNIERTIKGYLIELYNEFQTYIKEDIANLKFLHWDKNRIIAFDPENGNVEFEIYLPTPADTLESLPRFNFHKYVGRFDRAIKKIDNLDLPKMFDFSFWDFYYKYKPSWNPRDWVPPFDTFALVAGDQHFITFDQRQIDFGGRCSYILAKDMVDNQFTVIMNYNGKRRPGMKSLLVLAEGKSVEIAPDFSVKLDNRPTELPIKYQKLSVIRDGNLIQVNTGRGLVISGNLANQHIAFVLSGWYFGKVGGMLGSYDNEQYDDMIDRDGQVSNDVNVMAQTWEVGNRCRNPANIISEVRIEEGQKGFMKCSKLFVNSDSTLRPCFRVVEPAYFMKVCMAEMQTSKGDGCNAVSAYVKLCRQNDVMLWEPKTCITCETPNKEMYESGESIKLSPSSDDYHVQKSADVVMVVEQVNCNSNPASHLGDLVDKLEQAFAKNGIKDNRYGLIGFGGTPRSAFGRKSASSTHTFEGSIFSESNNFAKGKETLKFSYHFTDPMEAIMTAADMPFRTGVSKTIVLLHCGECSDSKNVNYNYLKNVLLNRGITLHIIRDEDIRLQGNSSPKNVIMGFDSTKKYMMKPMKDTTSNDIQKPEDSCVSLSMKTDGSVFHSEGLTSSKIRDRKWFLNTVSKRISETAVPDDCQVCQCVADHTGMAKSVCRTCYTSVSDYLPKWWSTWKHPSKIQNQFDKNFKEYFGDDTWKILSN
ncbi:apolipophorins-like [Mytilus californianus]|uniref:apolipophorins-like n=1 Tax=Mytilus californianus TaxID=6549 RepID=UPI0022465782|nr:apolipophorins-like [Mytilus californianus]